MCRCKFCGQDENDPIVFKSATAREVWDREAHAVFLEFTQGHAFALEIPNMATPAKVVQSLRDFAERIEKSGSVHG